MLYQKALHFLIILYVPFFAFAVPLFDTLGFLYVYRVIDRYYDSRARNAQDLGYFLMILANVIYFYYILFLAHWFIYPKEHKCGPILNGQDGWSPIEGHQETESSAFVGLVYRLVTFYPIVWVLLSFRLLSLK